jgi:hypothetical protein
MLAGGMPGGDFWRDDALMHHFRYIYTGCGRHILLRLLRKFPVGESNIYAEKMKHMEEDGS